MTQLQTKRTVINWLGVIAVAALTINPAAGQPSADAKGNVEVTPFTGTRGPRGITRWRPAQTVAAETLPTESVALKVLTVKPGDTVSNLMARNGLRVDAHTLQTVLAVNPERANLDSIEIGEQITIPDINRPDVTAVQLQLQPDLKLKTVESIKKLNNKVEDLRVKPSFIKVKPDTRSRIFAATATANEIDSLDVALLPTERNKLNAAIDDLEWALRNSWSGKAR